MIELGLMDLLRIVAFSVAWYLVCAGVKKLVEPKVMLERQKDEAID